MHVGVSHIKVHTYSTADFVLESQKHADLLLLGHHSNPITTSIKDQRSRSPLCTPRNLHSIMSSKQEEQQTSKKRADKNECLPSNSQAV